MKSSVKWLRSTINMDSKAGVEYYQSLKNIKRMSKRKSNGMVTIDHCNEQCEECMNRIMEEVETW
jgi:hypothetical protein